MPSRRCASRTAAVGVRARAPRNSMRTRATTTPAAERPVASAASPRGLPAVASSPTTALGRYRWAVERTLAWLNRFRRLTVRYERRADLHQAFLSLGCALICWRILTR